MIKKSNNKSLEPLAIVGIGCRLPGGSHGPDNYWKMMVQGVDAVTDVPADRWNVEAYFDPEPGKSGKTYARWGAFIERVDHFDIQPFGMSPHEAPRVDPQQRLLLEAAWEALEDAGEKILPARPSATGVFVGISTTDYSQIQTAGADRNDLSPYTATGTTMSIAANRISYCFNFTGPSFIVDTACSSALVAVHNACRALWNGECDRALAAGVNAILTPMPYLAFCAMNMLSPTGRCQAFDARANGFVRGEGVGAILIKPLSAALAAGDRVYAVIRGTAVNQDGRTSGMTVPSQSSQEALVRRACAEAGLSPAAIQFMEAHGTGTSVGDPIEAAALGTVLGAGRARGNFCRLGSVKTNIGHLEAGAGIAGIIKAALTLHRGVIPPNLHFLTPNPNIDFEALRLRVPTQAEPYGPGRRLAGVNSFGFGGTNAHAVLEDVNDTLGRARPREGKPVNIPASFNGNGHGKKISAPANGATPAPQLLVLSAKSEAALKAAAEKWRDHLPSAPDALTDVCFTAATRRTPLEHRLAVVGATPAELAEQLGAFAKGEPSPTLVTGQHAEDRKLAFVFSGQGPQWWAMGRELWNHEPVFRAKLEECDAVVRSLGSWSLVEELLAKEKKSRMNETEIAQPAICAFQIALAALWESWGIRPAAVVGHSVGEVAAAHVAGIFSLRDAMRVIYHRGRCMEHAPLRGTMLAANLSEDDARQRIAPYGERLSLAAVNSPGSVSISGDADAVGELFKKLEAAEVFVRMVPVNYAFHSAHMDPVRGELLAALKGLRAQKSKLPFYSTITGNLATGTELGPDYWWQNVRQTVRFAAATARLIEAGHGQFLELAAHPVLSPSVGECLAAKARPGTVLPSLRRQTPERVTMLGSLGALHTLGFEPEWRAVFPAAAKFVPVPGYAWQRERYWHEPEAARDMRLTPSLHPLMARRMRLPEMAWLSELDRRLTSWLNDHRVQGHMVFPAAGYLDLGLSTARELHGDVPLQLEDVEFSKPLFIPAGEESPIIQTTHDDADNSFRIHSRIGGNTSAWSLNAAGKHRPLGHRPPSAIEAREAVMARCPAQLTGAEFYERMQAFGLFFGPLFQGVQRVWLGNDESVGEIALPEKLDRELSRCAFHPALLDSCLQVTAAALLQQVAATEGRLFLPVHLERLRLFAPVTGHLWTHTRLVERGPHAVVFDLFITDDAGRLVAELRGMRSQAVEGTGTSTRSATEDLLYEPDWRLQRLPGRALASGPATFLPDLRTLAAQLRHALDEGEKEFNGRARYLELLPATNALNATYIRRAFGRLGWHPAVGERATTAQLLTRLRIAEKHARLFPRLLAMLAEDGWLKRRTANQWEVRRAPWFEEKISAPAPAPPVTEDTEAILRARLKERGFALPGARSRAAATPAPPAPPADDAEMDRRWREILSRSPGSLPDLSLIDRCGRELAAVLRGERDPLHLLVPEGSFNTLDHFYSNSRFFRGPNLLACLALATIAARLPEGRPLRILELGAGTGGLTANLLSVLPPTQTEYVFTDLSKAFFNRAEQRFREFPFVKYETLDLERGLAEQNFSPHSFDVVVASDVFHATADLRESLRRSHELLAPGGLLLFIEFETAPRGADLTFGLTDGWWKFRDHDLRPDYPLIDRQRWQAILKETGFQNTAVIAESEAGEEQQILVLARATADPGKRNGKNGHSTEPAAAGTWVLFEDHGGVARELGRRLAAHGQSCVFVQPGDGFRRVRDDEFTVGTTQPGDLQQLFAALAGRPKCRGVVHAWSLDAPGNSVTTAQLPGAEALVCHSTLHLAQALAELTDEPPALWLVTQSAQPVGLAIKSISVTQAPLIGLGRTLINELPHVRVRLVDLSPAPAAVELDALAAEVLAGDAEEEIALRGEARYVQRLEHRPERLRHALKPRVPLTQTACRLEVPRPGALDNVVFRPLERLAPGPGEVEIEVHAAGLNFRDVMKALGIYPSEAGDAMLLGDECAGRVVRVGEGVTEFKPGDGVMTLGAGCFASHLTMPAEFVLAKPAHLSYEEAATMLVAYMTAHYALKHLGGMRAGEKVLIHAATGGVGLAAVRLALAAGAEVFATAGSPEKRAFLRTLGVRHVFDSRTLAFADEILDVTGGSGVDLVLNSLAGEAIAKSLAVLGPHGRFLEIGKRDIYSNTRIGLRPFKNNLSYFAIDLSKAMEPGSIGGFLAGLKRQFANSELPPLPHRVFLLSDAVNAFRYMTQARQIGKIVLSMHADAVPLEEPPKSVPTSFAADATYLITGGLGGFGLATAEWMVANGAKHLVLASRRAEPSEGTRASLEKMAAAGAEIVLAKCDAANEADVAKLLARIAAKMPPLRGVIHSAMVLDDALIPQLTPERFHKVMAPKVEGAWNLHRLTQKIPLQFFVLFSSSSSTFGNPGQANYCAANAFLDALAHERRRLGLPALAVNWGLLAEVGIVAREARLAQHFRRMGLEGLTTRAAHNALGLLLMSGATQTTVWNVDWSRWAQMPGRFAKSPRFSLLTSTEALQMNQRDEGQRLRANLAAVPPGERLAIVQDFLRTQIAAVLRIAPAKLDLDRPLNEQGMDSLMAVELMHRLESQLGVSIPTGKLMGTPTITKISHGLLETLGLSGGAAGDAGKPGDAKKLVLTDDRDPAIEAEVQLPADLKFDGRPVERWQVTDPRAVLLTGTAEYIDLHLLRALLDHTSAKIFCLINEAGAERALAQLRAALKQRGLETAGLERRVTPVLGELSRPRFGLKEKEFAALAESVDAIYHTGAKVNHIAGYSDLKAANVGATVEVIRLASTGRTKPVHYLSGLAVFSAVSAAGARSALETDPLPASARLFGGYAQSRWVAEKILQLAGQRGVPVTIFRPGLMPGDSGHTVSGPDDGVWRLVNTCLELKCGPEGRHDLMLTPVDFASQAMVHIARRPDAAGRAFHLVNPQPVTLQEILKMAADAGYPVRLVSGEEWEKAIAQNPDHQASRLLLPYLMFIPDVGSETLRSQEEIGRVDSTQTQAAIAGAGFTCAPVNAERVRAWLQELVRLGELKEPSAAAAKGQKSAPPVAHA
ncbi:MAG: thioester reductase domain-containing protein [Verrucomicrobia bacterium]|nr:thioester reductase domain-containing protein [Verrucomicrobiota bacterium]